jgi:hypothetical protein
MEKMEIVLNDKEFELPKRTPKIAKLFDEFNATFGEGDVKVHNSAMKVLEATIGREGIKDVFGTADSEQISVVESAIAVKEIDDVYMAPLMAYMRKKEAEEMDSPALTAANELMANMANLSNLK